MKLWLISQSMAVGYDTYDSAVVAAETEQAAKETYPSGYVPDGWPEVYNDSYPDWAKPEYVKAECIGDATPGTPAGVICSSFNAG